MKPTYDPVGIESRWYRVWEESGAFRPEVNPDGEPFCIVIPPPNVTGILHMGHALNNTIQDVIIRRKRMQGFAALYLPGMDHAGIATQARVEAELASKGLSRHDLGRSDFVDRVWAWKEKSGGQILNQLRRLGFSCDWTRERFTLEERLSRAVTEVFVTLYEEGLIYRGNRIINWCPRCHTAISDIEVNHEDETGILATIRYPFVDGAGGVDVATTRPETMFGDTGVAVHPEDPRYADAVGRFVRLPLIGREVPIVSDSVVESEFGTGAIKVTPAHDATDFEIAERSGLPALVVLDSNARIMNSGGSFDEMDRFEARSALLEVLEKEGFLVAIEEHHHSVGRCSRCDTVIEPLLSLQWFVRVEPLVAPAIAAVRDGDVRFIPKHWEKSYFHWMENLRDWTISRQLWWGHRIPAWYCDHCPGDVIVSREVVTKCPTCGGPLMPDEDVLDTWFSSALWPFSTLGWPERTEDLERFYPTSVLVTGFDIIYFWVARMMQMALHFPGEKPFQDVVIHGLIRAEDGRKMSKSLGNTIDPIELVEKYGADAVRLTLMQSAAPGNDIPLDEAWVDAGRRFGNKLWNAFRFAVEHVGVDNVPVNGGYPDNPSPIDRWILARLAEVTAEYDALLDEYRFSDAVGTLYNFAWSEVFDWYLEMVKPAIRDEDRVKIVGRTLGIVLRDLLKLFHPIIPYITEELWGELVGAGLVVTASWPTPRSYEFDPHMTTFQELITGLRRFRSEHNLGARPLTVLIDDPVGASADWWEEQFAALAQAAITMSVPEDITGYTRLTAGYVQAFISLQGVIDPAEECPRLEKAITDMEGRLAVSTAKLANSNFLERAPKSVVDKEEAKADQFRTALEKLRAQYSDLC